MNLEVEIMPSDCWGRSLRTSIPRSLWNKLRKEAYAEAGSKCVACGDTGKWECHEEWVLDNDTQIQTLDSLIPLCYMCHKVKHFYLSISVFEFTPEVLIEHFCKVNGTSPEDFEDYNQEKLRVLGERENLKWGISLGKYSRYHAGEVSTVSTREMYLQSKVSV